MTSQRPGGETVLYQASFARWLRVLAGALTVITIVGFGAPIRAWLLYDRGPDWVPIFAASVLVIIFAIIWRGSGQKFTVTNRGVILRGWWRTVRIPWAEVAAIDADHRYLSLGQTIVVTRTGRRIGSPITGARFDFRRAETGVEHGIHTQPSGNPTLAALDAWHRYLRGEFGDVTAG